MSWLVNYAEKSGKTAEAPTGAFGALMASYTRSPGLSRR